MGQLCYLRTLMLLCVICPNLFFAQNRALTLVANACFLGEEADG